MNNYTVLYDEVTCIIISKSNANYGHSLGTQKFGIRENIEAFPVGIPPLVPMK